jgi:hypothetical protein
MHFREEPVTPVYRHWMCEQVGCNGELLSTGESITKIEYKLEASLRQVRPRRLGGCHLPAGRTGDDRLEDHRIQLLGAEG